MWISPKTNLSAFECDEIYWYIKSRKGNEKGVNTYIMTMISREPRQIVSFVVGHSVNSESLQQVADGAPAAEHYYTDGCSVYRDVVFGGTHKQNIHNKKDTHNIESTNADLRHYLAGLARRSRTFYRSQETLEAVLYVFINAYNKYGEYKANNQIPVKHKSVTPSKHLHKFKELPLSIIDFV